MQNFRITVFNYVSFSKFRRFPRILKETEVLSLKRRESNLRSLLITRRSSTWEAAQFIIWRSRDWYSMSIPFMFYHLDSAMILLRSRLHPDKILLSSFQEIRQSAVVYDQITNHTSYWKCFPPGIIEIVIKSWSRCSEKLFRILMKSWQDPGYIKITFPPGFMDFLVQFLVQK
jgi:hypothetical protein